MRRHELLQWLVLHKKKQTPCQQRATSKTKRDRGIWPPQPISIAIKLALILSGSEGPKFVLSFTSLSSLASHQQPTNVESVPLLKE
ncbi:hypothetical protein Csa_008241 [Cucumis sativus]|uniref:Uncharacterized protein n=1 Tax=Cucumis sativus TaxID=3659 RepID=A0A0A0KR51_CUCSA|nr:hypothetical protein Csa_008241 [Cucumis sativus]